MYIVMNMNIYITKDNEEKLRKLDDWTMSGLINYLLEKHWDDPDSQRIKSFKKTTKNIGIDKEFDKDLNNWEGPVFRSKDKL